MRVLIDYHGTLVGNPDLGLDDRGVRLLLRSLRTKMDVAICSGDPGGLPEDFRAWLDMVSIPLIDKVTLTAGRLTDAVVVDDQPAILACASRAGAITVPAARIRDFFTLFV